jgi:hypothetical protein
MPDGDFFWNAWRTYTAFSNRTVYTARYAFASCDSTTSRTPDVAPSLLSQFWDIQASAPDAILLVPAGNELRIELKGNLAAMFSAARNAHCK